MQVNQWQQLVQPMVKWYFTIFTNCFCLAQPECPPPLQPKQPANTRADKCAITHTCLRWHSVILSLMASWSGRYLLWRRCCQLCVSSKSPISADGERKGAETGGEAGGQEKIKWRNSSSSHLNSSVYSTVGHVACAEACVSICPTAVTKGPAWCTICRCTHTATELVVTTATKPYHLACCGVARRCLRDWIQMKQLL